MKIFIQKLLNKSDFSDPEIREAFAALLEPDTLEQDIGEFLLALSQRPVDAHWLTVAAQVLRDRATPVSLGVQGALDTAGTGGDRTGSFNFSTAAALVAAACGAYVAKHGNRSITSKSGSADLLEALGIPINLEPEEVARSVAVHHFGFMLAPNYHPAMKKVQQVRRQLGVVTLFNFLGPLVNPAGVKRQLIGVYDDGLRPVMAEAVRRLGVEKAWVVWGEGGMDEMSLGGKTHVSEVTPSGIVEKVVTPEDGVLRSISLSYLKGGDARQNAKILQGIFERSFFGPIVSGVLFNAAAALCVGDLAKDLRDGVAQARLTIDNGEAMELLEKLRGNTL